MVGGAAWSAGQRELRRLPSAQIDLGLHLDLTEVPLSPRSARPVDALIFDSWLRRLDRHALRAEIRAQLDVFEEAVGRAPNYVDGHQHVHQFPVVREQLLEELGIRYGEHGPWLRSTRRARLASPAAPAAEWRGRLKPWIIERLGAQALARLAQRQGLKMNGHLLGVYDFCGGPALYAQRLACWLAAAETGDLLMCHPSLPWTGGDPLIDARHAEFQVLGAAGLPALWHAAGIELRPMSAILAGQRA